jgi:hypothetical protein
MWTLGKNGGYFLSRNISGISGPLDTIGHISWKNPVNSAFWSGDVVTIEGGVEGATNVGYISIWLNNAANNLVMPIKISANGRVDITGSLWINGVPVVV